MKPMIRSLAAFSILAVAIQACSQAPGTQVNPLPSPSATAANNGQTGGNNGGNAGTPTPGATATPDAGLNTVATLSGKVYNDEGSPVDGAKITVTSLNASKPFTATADVKAGAYVINGLPEGVLLQVAAQKDGWTQRTQTAVLVPSQNGNFMNFGGSGNAYFIAQYPEIEAVEPAQDATVDGSKLSYTLKLSEALDDVNKRRLENAIRLIPADAAANGGGSPTDIKASEDAGYPYDLTVEDASGAIQIANYAVSRGATFMGNSDQRATITWSADGLSAKLEFNAPLIASKDNDAKYQVALVSGGDRILDKNGKQLGTDANGSFSAYPAAGHLILGAFKPQTLALKTITGLTAGGAAEAWAATHDNVADFKVAKDDVAPTITGVDVVKMDNATRVELTFSEPMAAYDGGSNSFKQASLTDLTNYTFALGASGDNLADFKMDGSTDVADLTSTTATYGAADERIKEFKFASGATISVDPLNAKRVFFTINKPNFFNVEARDLKVRVAGVADPAGNTISTSGDANVKLGTL